MRSQKKAPIPREERRQMKIGGTRQVSAPVPTRMRLIVQADLQSRPTSYKERQGYLDWTLPRPGTADRDPRDAENLIWSPSADRIRATSHRRGDIQLLRH